MAGSTTNYNIRKPEPSDSVNVELDIAQPLEDIDGILATKADGDHTHEELVTEATVTTVVNDVINGAPGALDTLNELAAALGDDADFAASVTTALAGKSNTDHEHDADYEADGAVAAHAAVTTNVHGMADTALLITEAAHALIDHDDLPGIEANIPIQDEAPADPELHDLWVDEDEPAPSGSSGSYVALPADPPTSASQILGLSDDDPLTTDWIDPPAGGGASDSDQNILATRIFG